MLTYDPNQHLHNSSSKYLRNQLCFNIMSSLQYPQRLKLPGIQRHKTKHAACTPSTETPHTTPSPSVSQPRLDFVYGTIALRIPKQQHISHRSAPLPRPRRIQNSHNLVPLLHPLQSFPSLRHIELSISRPPQPLIDCCK